MIICPRCGHQAPDGTPWCPNCGYGKPQQPPMPVQQPRADFVSSGSEEGRKLATRLLAEKLADAEARIETMQQQIRTQSRQIVILSVALALALVIVFILNSYRSDYKNQAAALSRAAATRDAELQTLRQTAEAAAAAVPAEPPAEEPAAPAITEAPTETPTDMPTATATSTPEPKIPDYCGLDMQVELSRLAKILNTDEHPSPESYYPEENACVFTIRNTHSFLNTESYGYITFRFDNYNEPWCAVLDLNFVDSPEFIELATDWAAVAYSYINKSVDPLTAYATITSAETKGMEIAGDYTIGAELKRDTMTYQIGIIDMSRVLIEE